MSREFNLENELASPEVKSFEKRYSESVGRQVVLRDIPIKNFVDTTTGLLQTKVNSLLMKGARDAAGFWPDLINTVQMSAPKEDVPIVSERDFKVRIGKMPRTGNEQSGGKFTKVSLDTTDDDKIRYVYLQIDEEDVKLRNFDIVERSLVAAGGSLAKHILTDLTSHYKAVAGNSQALSTDKRFVALFKAIDLNAQDGFDCSAVIFESLDFVEAITEETTGGTMPWLTGLQGNVLGDNFADGVGMINGLAGRLFGRIPVYVVANDSGLAGNILGVDVAAASVFGFAPGGALRVVQEVQQMQDLVENKITTKYDIQNGNANGVFKVTGA